MKKGICPNCGSKDIWMNKEIGKENSYMLIGFLSSMDKSTYCCLGCGLTQSFIDQNELENGEKMAKLKDRFTKV